MITSNLWIVQGQNNLMIVLCLRTQCVTYPLLSSINSQWVLIHRSVLSHRRCLRKVWVSIAVIRSQIIVIIYHSKGWIRKIYSESIDRIPQVTSIKSYLILQEQRGMIRMIIRLTWWSHSCKRNLVWNLNWVILQSWWTISSLSIFKRIEIR